MIVDAAPRHGPSTSRWTRFTTPPRGSCRAVYSTGIPVWLVARYHQEVEALALSVGARPRMTEVSVGIAWTEVGPMRVCRTHIDVPDDAVAVALDHAMRDEWHVVEVERVPMTED